ncbi:hypothetical protein EJ06DRAFT_531739 [Trichodelitschia bisporula]|uniref:Uncharacterized protein n=1 Tax=Trichodelitschia bisporula TaxID=703511 RepID=A0A6G1HRJ3_9PEZI|nr:hypothetical protein EJ06DRAFT_531739 [Trichodelitschia bisporula]
MASDAGPTVSDVLYDAFDPFKQYYGHKALRTVQIAWEDGSGGKGQRKVTQYPPVPSDPDDNAPAPEIPEADVLDHFLNFHVDRGFKGMNVLIVPVAWQAIGRDDLEREQRETMRKVFESCRFPKASLAAFLHNDIAYQEFGGTHHLAMRQWALIWNSNPSAEVEDAVFLWLHGPRSWDIPETFISFLTKVSEPATDFRHAGCLTAVTLVSKSLGEEDEEVYLIESEIKEYLRCKHEGRAPVVKRDITELSITAAFVASRIRRHKDRLAAVRDCRNIGEAMNRDIPLEQVVYALLARATRIIDDITTYQLTLHTWASSVVSRDSMVSLRTLTNASFYGHTLRKETAVATKSLAQHSRRDSAFLRRMAFVTTSLLPATLMAPHLLAAALLWSGREGPWARAVVEKPWALTPPLAILVFIVFWVGLGRVERRERAEDDRELERLKETREAVEARRLEERRQVEEGRRVTVEGRTVIVEDHPEKREGRSAPGFGGLSRKQSSFPPQAGEK